MRRPAFVPHVLRSVALLVSLLSAFTCFAAAFPRTVTDGLGQEIYLAEPPQRIFSAALAIDNLLLALVDPERVVAVTRYATQPEFGSFVADKVRPHMILVDALSPEYVIAAHPDIVLVAVWNDRDAVEQIRRLGYKVYTFTEFDDVADTLANIARIGEVTGAEAQARALIDGFNARYEAVAARVAGRPAPTVLYWNSWFSSVGSGTGIDDVIRRAGGRNVVSEAGIAGWPQIDAEFVLQARPDVIITDSGPSFVDRILADPVLASVPAVQEGRVYHVDYLDALDHHVILAIERLARLLHPEAFEAEGQ